MEDLLTGEAATAHVADVWSGAEYPEDALDRDTWIELFELAGYTIDDQSAERPTEPITLYRGAQSRARAATLLNQIAP